MSAWDPIGVQGIPQAVDEYDSYIDGIYRLLSNGAPNGALAQYLKEIETVRMGLTDAAGDPLAPDGHREAAVKELQNLKSLI